MRYIVIVLSGRGNPTKWREMSSHTTEHEAQEHALRYRLRGYAAEVVTYAS